MSHFAIKKLTHFAITLSHFVMNFHNKPNMKPQSALTLKTAFLCVEYHAHLNTMTPSTSSIEEWCISVALPEEKL